LGTLALRAERQSARMSKIKNGRLDQCAGFPLSGMSGKIRECQGILYKLECQGIVREFWHMSGNFLWKMAMPSSAFAFHCGGSMGRQDHYDLRG